MADVKHTLKLIGLSVYRSLVYFSVFFGCGGFSQQKTDMLSTVEAGKLRSLKSRDYLQRFWYVLLKEKSYVDELEHEVSKTLNAFQRYLQLLKFLS